MSFIAWSSNRLDVKLGWGSGQKRTPFSYTRRAFGDTIAEFGFTTKIMRRVRNCQSFFKHCFTGQQDTTSRPTHLLIARLTYEHHAFLCQIRSEISSLAPSSTNCLFFLKQVNPSMQLRIEEAKIRACLDTNRDDLDRHPSPNSIQCCAITTSV